MLNKKITLTGILFSLLTLSVAVSADLDVSKFKNPKTFNGTVVSLSTTNVKMGLDYGNYKGFVNYVVPPGTIFSGPILNKDGNVIKPGTILARMETEVCKTLVRKAETELDTKHSLYDRYCKIIEKGGKGAISEQAFLKAKNEYLAAKAELMLAEKRLESCTYNAQFDGVVNEVLFPGGYTTASDRDIINVSQLVPIGVEVEMDRREAFKYGANTPIAIYPLGRDNKPVGPYRGATKLTKKGVMFVVTNYRPENATKKLADGRTVPVVTHIAPVVPFDENRRGDSLSVYSRSIMKDDKGSYVMKVKGQNITCPINPKFDLEKVYIKPANEISPIESSVRYVKLADAGSLQVNDTVLTKKEVKNLKDGDTVFFEKSRYIFMPGDPVKVVLDSEVADYNIDN